MDKSGACRLEVAWKRTLGEQALGLSLLSQVGNNANILEERAVESVLV